MMMKMNRLVFCYFLLQKLISINSRICVVSAAAANSRNDNDDDNDDNKNNNHDENSIPKILIGKDVNGDIVEMPLVGAGTWQYNETIAYQSVCKAFAAGYTFIDTAFNYKNQKGVGRAIQDCWDRPRNELFLMTKIPGGLDPSQTHAAHVQNLLELQLDYVDHLMVHYPADWDQQHASPENRQTQWLAMEQIYKSGQAKTIGVSHYCPRHIQDILQVSTIGPPSVNQVEYHIGSQDIDHVIEICQKYNITFMSFSPLCGPCNYEPQDSLINGALVSEIASHYDDESVTPSQVSLRYIVQQGIPVIPKSNTMGHIKSNIDIFDFELTQDDMEQLSQATTPRAEGGDCDVP